MKYADGTVGSIVLKNGRTVKHSGFTEIALSAANPAAIVGAGMQAMAAISGQYYMHQISTQLRGIDKKLDKLVGFHHDEKIGQLISIDRSIGELTTKINVDAADIIAIQSSKQKADEIFFEYHTRLYGVDISSVINVKSRWLDKAKELRELKKNIDGSEIGFSIRICYYADEIREKCILTEIAIRMKMGGHEEAIAELYDRLHTHHYEAFYCKVNDVLTDRYSAIEERANEVLGDGQNISAAARDVFDSIMQGKNDLQELFDSKEQKNLVAQMLQSFNEPREILYLPGNSPDEQRMFVAAEDETTRYFPSAVE